MYTVSFVDVAVSVAQDLFELQVPADLVMRLHRVRITQSSDAGDAESEQLKFAIKRGIGNTSGSGGTTPTPAKHATGDVASSVTTEANNTTQAVAGGGSLTTLLAENENVHLGFDYRPTPEERIDFSPSENCIVSLDGAPADALTMSGYAVFEEIGG